MRDFTGSVKTFTNAPLELVNFICAVFNLAPEIEDEVRVMRRCLLQLIGVDEFSTEAEFVYPSLSLILPHVLCSFCQLSHPLDLTYPNVSLSCPNCNQPHPNAAIDLNLVSLLRRNLSKHQSMDVKCLKCNKVKVSNLLKTCPVCACPFQQLSSSATERQQLLVFKKVAEAHHFRLLLEVADWALKHLSQ